MPFPLAGNLDKVNPEALVRFQKKFGIILSENQFVKQQNLLIQNALNTRLNYISVMQALTKKELISFLFLLSQFGDALVDEAPGDYLYFENNPYILEWQPGTYMIPWEIIEYLSHEKIFRKQNYLFALIPGLTVKEKKAWIKWMGVDYEGESERELNIEIYHKCRLLQKPFNGKSWIHETEFSIQQLWPIGTNKYLDWYYKRLTPFYYALQELSSADNEAFFAHTLEVIKAGKFVLKKEPEKFREKELFKIVSTVEGSTSQFRNTIYNWEVEKKKPEDYLFYQL